MSVRKKIIEPNGVFFITFTCAEWLPLFELADGYQAVYNWFDYLKSQGHHIAGYVIMPNHIHALIAFKTSRLSINSIVGNGKRFMAYELVKRLEALGKKELLAQLSSYVNATEQCKIKSIRYFSHRSTGKNATVFHL
jgi:REP element-mobilizing transposase RayT